MGFSREDDANPQIEVEQKPSSWRRKGCQITLAVAAIVLGFGLTIILAPHIICVSLGTMISLLASSFKIGGFYTAAVVAFNRETTWKSFGAKFLTGCCIALVASAFSVAASGLITGLVAKSSGLIMKGISIGIQCLFDSLSGLVTNGISNKYGSNRNFWDNWLPALCFGIVNGFIACGLEHVFQHTENSIVRAISDKLRHIGRQHASDSIHWTTIGRATHYNSVHLFAASTFKTFGRGGVSVMGLLLGYFKRAPTSSEQPHSRSSTASNPGGENDDMVGPEEVYPDEDDEIHYAEDALEYFIDGQAETLLTEIEPINLVPTGSDTMPDPSPIVTTNSNNPGSLDPPKGSIIRSQPECTPRIADVVCPQEMQGLAEDQDSSWRLDRETRKQLIQTHVDKYAEIEDDHEMIENRTQLMNFHEILEAMKNMKKEELTNNQYLCATTDGLRLTDKEGSIGSSSHPQAIRKTTEESTAEQKKKDNDQSLHLLDKLNISQKSETISPGKKITVLRLITFDKDGNYKLSAEAEELNYAGEMSVIGLMGTPKVGKTTLGQIILFLLGYKISKPQAAMTKWPIGDIYQSIHAYVLHEDNLIIIECCEGVDPRVKNESKSPFGALLLEVFTYLFCMKLVYVVQYDSAKELKKYTASRMKMLMNAAEAHGTVRQHQFDLVLRAPQFNKEHDDEIKKLTRCFTTYQATVDARGIVIPLTEEENELNELQARNKITVNPLRFFRKDDNTLETTEYDRQCGQIINIIKSATKEKSTCAVNMNDHPINCEQFHANLKEVWTKLEKSKSLQEVLASVRAEEIQKQNNTSKKDPAQIFLSNVRHFMKKIRKTQHKAFVTAYNNQTKETNDKSEKFKQAPNQGENTLFYVESVIKLADLILQHSCALSSTDMKLKEEGIRTSLGGFMTFLMTGSNTPIEIMALKMSFYDCNLMKMLNQPEVYKYQPNCWHLLSRLARSGFRIPVLDFDIWKATSKLLKKTQLETDYEIRIYVGMLALLEELTNADPSHCIPKTGHFHETPFSDGIRMETVLLEFEKDISNDISVMIADRTSDPSQNQVIYDKWLKLPETWFNASEYFKMEFESEALRTAIVKRLLDILTTRNFEILYRLIAETVSKQILARSSDFISTKFSNKNQDIQRRRLLLWRNIADDAGHNKEIFRSLLDSDLLDFIIDEYVSKQETSTFFPYALNILVSMIAAEKRHKDDNDMYIHETCLGEKQISNVLTSTELTERDRPKLLAQKWTWVRLYCLKKGIVDKLISYFLERQHSQGVQFLLCSLTTFLVKGDSPEERNLSENVYMAKRHLLLRQIAVEMAASAEKVKALLESDADSRNNNEYQVHMGILRSGCEFINRILDIYYSRPRRQIVDDEEKEQSNKSETYSMLVSVAADLYTICMSQLPPTSTSAEKQKSLYLKLHYLNFVLNLASIAQKNIGGILKSHGITNIGIVDYAPESIHITYEEKDFLSLKMDVEYKDHHKLAVVAADFLEKWPVINENFGTILSQLTNEIKQLQEELAHLKEEREKYQKWLNEQNTLREKHKHEKSKVTVMDLTSVPVAPSTSAEITYAIEDVEVGASAILMLNDMKNMKESFVELFKFLKIITKDSTTRPFKIRRTNPRTQILCNLAYFEKVLDKLGYCLQDDYYVTDKENFNLDYAVNFQKELQLLTEQIANLDSRFKIASSREIGKDRLPPSFFDSKNNDYDFHSKLSIDELLDRRPYLERVPSQLQYTLVRVYHETSSDCYQAVFTPSHKISQIMNQLKLIGITVLYKEEVGDLNDTDQHLKEIGGFVIQLKGC